MACRRKKNPKTSRPEVSMRNSDAAVNAGSFRDRDGRVYHYQDRVFRGLSESALENYRRLQEKSFYTKLAESGKVIGTREISAEENPLPGDVQAQWSGFLEHEPVPVISYPYEWTFSMLKAAASLQLHLVERAVSNGFTLKDATPYNIQFVNRNPVFIDIPSFEEHVGSEPWVGYRQFCQMFLYRKSQSIRQRIVCTQVRIVHSDLALVL